MSIAELILAAQVIIDETAFTKNSGGRIGSLIKAIITTFDQSKANLVDGKVPSNELPEPVDISGKIDKVVGKGLSTNDFDNTAKAAVEGFAAAISSAIGLEVAARNAAISTAISNLADTAPDTLDTLNEIAAALGDDPNFATTIITLLGGKADLVGGKVPLNQLPEGLGVADDSVLPGKIGSNIIEQDPDWAILFTTEGNRTFVDDEHGVNRPELIQNPAIGETISYNCQSFCNKQGMMSVFAVRVDTMVPYLLQKGDDGIIQVANMVQSDGSIRHIQICETSEEFTAIDPKDPFTLYFVKTA